jgi:hypothetical protein
MLHDTKTPPPRSSTLRRGTVITLTLAAAVFAAGLRPPQGRQALAQQEGPAAEETRNNLKRIGRAFHDYHDVFGHLPQVVYGASGNGKSKNPHSWRVAILPFVGAADLYNQYHFDEPWDSEHNLKIAAQMPAIFRSPNDDRGSTNAAYFVLVGEKTIVGDKPQPDGNPTKGIRVQDITDGTSNTIMVVEAKRDIPWTKPEDIAYSPNEALPNLGGWYEHGFHACFGDGAVRLISENIDEQSLRSLITRNGGEVVNLRQ